MSSTLNWLLRRLRALPAAAVEVAGDDSVELTLRLGDGPTLHVQVVLLHRLSGRLVAQVLADAQQGASALAAPPRLFVVERLRPAVRAQFADARISWAEMGSDLLHLDLAPYYVHDAGRPTGAASEKRDRLLHGQLTPRWAEPRPAKLVGRSGLCAEALVLWADVLRARPEALPPLTGTALAAVAGVTVTLATRILHRLEEEGALDGVRGQQRTVEWRITDPERIIERWAAEDRAPVRVTRAYVYARSGRDLLAKLSQLWGVTSAWALGGVAAANVYAPTLTADPILTVWLLDAMLPSAAAEALGGEIVTEGANLVFWQTARDAWAQFRCPTESPNSPWLPSVDAIGRQPKAHRKAPPHWVAAFRQLALTASQRKGAPPIALVSRYRALTEAMQDESGRAEEVAAALRERLALPAEHG